MRILKTIGLTVFFVLFAYGTFFAAQTLRPRSLALKLPDNLQPGDVVLMRSHTWRAELVRLIDGVPYRDGYSHVGLVQRRNDAGNWELVHAIPGKDGTVQREAWPDIARGGGISEAVIFRAGINPETRVRLVALQERTAQRAVPFDSEFDHHDPSKLYCTELVTELYAKAGHPVVTAEVLRKRAIFPGHLANSEKLKMIGTTRDGLP